MQQESKRISLYQWLLIGVSSLLLGLLIFLTVYYVQRHRHAAPVVLRVGVCRGDSLGLSLADAMSPLWAKPLEIHYYSTPDSLLSGLSDKEFDVTATPVARTQDVARQYTCSDALLSSRLVLVSHVQAPMLSYPSSMGAKTISYNSNGAIRLRLHHLMTEMCDTIFSDLHSDWSTHQLLDSLNAGRVSYAIVPDYAYSRSSSSWENIQSNCPVGFDQDYVLLMRRDADVMDMKLLNELIHKQWIQ